METRANHVWVGAITLLLLAIAAGLIVWMAKLNQGKQHLYDIYFSQAVDGLSKGSSVNFSGVPVGQVFEIELWRKDPSFVRVRIKVDDKTPILVGTSATIQSSFTGPANIQLVGAVRGAPALVCPKANAKLACPDGVPVIPTRRGGIGELLNSAPLLLERLATLTEKMSNVFSDENQKSLTNVLANSDKVTASLATAGPRVDTALAELQTGLAQARTAFAAYEKVANSADAAINTSNLPQLTQQMRDTMASAQTAANELRTTLAGAQPATRRLTETTLPNAEATLQDLRQTTQALRTLTEQIQDGGAGALVGGPRLPDYEP
jgi:phospholipid/cholesterol/gamma-HCH transport system substrate-binding protein